ncbi:unnamed protein product [Withania somnifera]
MASTSSSSIRSSMILCVVCAFLLIQSTSNPISNLCAKSKNPSFCLSVLNDYFHQNLNDLTETTINLAKTNASSTAVKINFLLNQTSDSNLEEIYNLCTTYYNGAIRALGNAQQFLDMGQYQNLNTVANLVVQDAFNCEVTFEVTPGYVSNITKENDDLQNLGAIVIAAANLLASA